jgi:hypothetical protein
MAETDEVHQRLEAHALRLDLYLDGKACETSQQAVMEFRTGRHLARYELLATDIRPFNRASFGKPMFLWQGDMEGFRPQLCAFAVPGLALPRNENDVEFARSKRGYVLVTASIANINPNLR